MVSPPQKKAGIIVIELCSTQSMRVSLASLRNGSGGLDAHRQTMLNRAPCSGDWARFPLDHLTMKDLAYLTAKTGHEFAILRGRSEDILFHGESLRCTFDDILVKIRFSGLLDDIIGAVEFFVVHDCRMRVFCHDPLVFRAFPNTFAFCGAQRQLVRWPAAAERR